jgi:hypothetical protein
VKGDLTTKDTKEKTLEDAKRRTPPATFVMTFVPSVVKSLFLGIL